MRSLKRSRQRGSSLLETALVVPLLLFILAGVVDIGLAYHTYIVMINAAREGARYGINHPWDTSGIRARVLNEAYNSDVDLSEATITVDTQGPGTPVRVTVRLNYSTVVMGSILGLPSFPIEASATFRAR